MTDIIEQAEAALEGVTEGAWDVQDGFVYPLSIRCSLGGIRTQDARFIAQSRTLVPELVAALKTAHADAWALVEEKQELRDKLKAARAENERLQDRWDAYHPADSEECDRNDLIIRNKRLQTMVETYREDVEFYKAQRGTWER